MRTPELLAVGETMAMLAPREREDLATAEVFRLDAGGAESNVAAHAAAVGVAAAWFSRLGDDALGHRIVRQLGERGVDVSSVVFDGAHPTGLYVKEPGSGVRYYRSGSAASRLSPADLAAVSLGGVRMLHVSGITAAISDTAHEFLAQLIDRARAAGVTVSFDVNYRAALWEAGVAAVALERLARRCDLVFVGRDEAESLWGTSTAREVRARFPDIPELVIKDGDVGATVFGAEGEVFEPSEVVDVVVDAVGAGDAFAGGYLAGVLSGASVRSRLRDGHRRSALTLSTTADSVDEGMPA